MHFKHDRHVKDLPEQSSKMVINFSSVGEYSAQKNNSPVKLKNIKNKYENLWLLNKNFGCGFLRKIELRPGFDIYITNYKVTEPLVTHFQCRRSAFSFGFSISGDTKVLASSLPRSCFIRKSQNPIFYYPDQSGIVEDMANSHRLGIHIILEPEQLHSLLQGGMDYLPADFKKFLDGSVDTGMYNYKSRITPAVSQILNQLFYCSHSGITRQLFFESKAIELIALQLDQVKSSAKSKIQHSIWSRSDVDKIHFAAAQLCLDLENPPSLLELTTSAGISHTKLNRGFKKVFGTTAFGYLRQMRLKQAKTLLEEGSFNVTESAFAVGYNSLSSFTRAFRDQYGCNPNCFMTKNDI